MSRAHRAERDVGGDSRRFPLERVVINAPPIVDFIDYALLL